MPPRKNRTDLYKFHYCSQLPVTETRSQRKARLDCLKRTKAEVGNRSRQNIHGASSQNQNPDESAALSYPDPGTDEHNPLGFSENSPWEDVGEIMNEEDAASLARIWSFYQQLIQQQKHRNWKDVMGDLFPVYLYLKKQTSNWTLPCAFDDFSSLVCNCPTDKYKPREVDLIDLMGTHIWGFNMVCFVLTNQLCHTVLYARGGLNLCSALALQIQSAYSQTDTYHQLPLSLRQPSPCGY